ncbi:MAG: hypothetical protein FJW69_09725 [Actinobacteria bacterium]|nr:hypothetical protein [Actinomycetota bacterium]
MFQLKGLNDKKTNKTIIITISDFPYPLKIFLKFIENKITPIKKIIIEKNRFKGVKKLARFPIVKMVKSPKIPKTANFIFLKSLISLILA